MAGSKVAWLASVEETKVNEENYRPEHRKNDNGHISGQNTVRRLNRADLFSRRPVKITLAANLSTGALICVYTCRTTTSGLAKLL